MVDSICLCVCVRARALMLRSCSLPYFFNYLSRQLKKRPSPETTIKGTEIYCRYRRCNSARLSASVYFSALHQTFSLEHFHLLNLLNGTNCPLYLITLFFCFALDHFNGGSIFLLLQTHGRFSTSEKAKCFCSRLSTQG